MQIQEQVGDFLQLSSDSRHLLKHNTQLVSLSRADGVIEKGQAVSGAYLVLQGQLRVYTYTPQGTEATLYFLRPGELCVLALNCLFNDLLYPAWVEADDDTRVAVIPGPVYRELFTRESSVQNMTVKALSTLVFRLMDELEQIHSCNLDQRLASFLLNNASNEGIVGMTQQALANHLGTTREVIARLMQNFGNQGLVSTQRGKISILDPLRLGAVVKVGG